MGVVIVPMKIYEIQGGNEVYKWDQDWLLCDADQSTFNESQAGQYKLTYAEALAAVRFPKCTMFYITTTTDAGLVHVPRGIDMTWAIGKTIRAYVKPQSNNRYIEISFTLLSDTTYTRVVRIEYRYKYNDTTYLYDYSTISVDRQGDNRIYGSYFTMPFLSKNDDAYIGGSAREWWDYNTEVRQYSITPYWNYSDSFKYWVADWDPKEYDDENPYVDGGTSGEGGGGGNFSDDSDSVSVDNLPVLDAVGTGFATIFTPSKYQLTQLANVMWDNNVFTALQNLVQNISDMFTSLAIVPFSVQEGATVEVTWFGFNLTGIYLTLASKQFYEFDMGSINMADDARIYTSGSALDYSPFSRLGIYLPFIGFQDLDIDECRDATLNLKYRIDILSGACVALISINGNTIYQFSGNCLSQIPITNENMQSLVADAVQVGIAATASHAAAGAASSAGEAVEGAINTGKSSNITSAVNEYRHSAAHVSYAKANLASATANAAMGIKPTFGKAGAISAASSLLAVRQPYLFLTTPNQCIPDHYQRYNGFPSNITDKLGNFSGFTVVEDIRLNGLVATSSEVDEIYQLLREGVII